MSESLERTGSASPTDGRTDELRGPSEFQTSLTSVTRTRTYAESAAVLLALDPFLPAREAATRWQLLDPDEVQAVDCHAGSRMGCTLCGAT